MGVRSVNWFEMFKIAAKEWEKFPERQRTFPFMHDHENPLQRSVSDGVEEEGEEQYESKGLYHVTTNLAGVMSSMRLKSRKQLGQVSGLGGGDRDEASNKISMTYNYQKAIDLYHEFHYVSAIIQNRFSASQIFHRMMAFSVDDNFDYETIIPPMYQVAVDFGVPKKVIIKDTNGSKIDAILNKKVVTPEQKYELFRSLESAAITENHSEWDANISPVAGFTVDFSSMKNIVPQQIAIIQCAIRKDARIEHVYNELEIRVLPRDVVIVRYMQPKPSI